MAPSHLKRALRNFDDELSGFAQTLQQEIHELRRNVENRPVTGATSYRHCLEDLNERLSSIGEDLAALEAVSLDAISLEELVGHSVALYKSNHQQIERLELQLQKYGYADLFSPVPPEDPLDMLELRAARTGGKGAGGAAARQAAAHLLEGDEDEEEEDAGGADAGAAAAVAYGGEDDHAAGAAGAGAWASDAEEDEEGADALAEVTNRLAGVALNAMPGTVARPRPAALQAGLAPMTAAKALMRADTPSSLSSPDALSPSMRELLGKYGGSGSDASAAPTSAARRRSTLGGGGAGGAPASPAPAYLSPAFQLAAMEQELQLQASEAAHHREQAGTPGTTPTMTGADALAAALALRGAHAAHAAVAAAGQEPDGMVLTAMKQTAQKLHDKPGFLEQYRQKFPHIVASTERLLDTVQKGRRPEPAPAAAAEPQQQQQQQLWQPAGAACFDAPAAGGRRAEMVEDDNTLELRAQLLGGGLAKGGSGSFYGSMAAAPSDITDDLSRAAAAATSYRMVQPVQPSASAAAAAPAPTPVVLPPPSAVRAAGAAPTPAPLPSSVPPLRPVEETEYGVLPSFIRGQLPLEALNERLAALHTLLTGRVAAGGHGGFVMADVEALGLGPKGKTFVNSLVKLGRAQLRVAFGGGGAGGTTYLLS